MRAHERTRIPKDPQWSAPDQHRPNPGSVRSDQRAVRPEPNPQQIRNPQSADQS